MVASTYVGHELPRESCSGKAERKGTLGSKRLQMRIERPLKLELHDIESIFFRLECPTVPVQDSASGTSLPF
jgi:hypothetical protein